MNVLPRPVIAAAAVGLLLGSVMASYQLGREQGIRSERARYVPSDQNGRLIFLPKSEVGFDQAGLRNTLPDVRR